MSNIGNQSASSAQFESAPELRDQHILEMTGIRPHPGNVPAEETRRLIQGIHDGDPNAMENLIASRLTWAYDKFAQLEEVQRRSDLSLEDIMQIGSLATIEAALKLNPDGLNIDEVLQNKVPYEMGKLIVRSKLLPSVSENGPKIANAKYPSDRSRMIDEASPVGDEKKVAEQGVLHESLIDTDMEEEAMTNIAYERLWEAVWSLDDDRQREVIAHSFGLVGAPMSHGAIGKKLNVSGQTIRRVEAAALALLRGELRDSGINHLIDLKKTEDDISRETHET